MVWVRASGWGAGCGGLKLCRLPWDGGVQGVKDHPLEEPLRLPGMAGCATWLLSQLKKTGPEGLEGEGPAWNGRRVGAVLGLLSAQ